PLLTHTLFPYTTLFRSLIERCIQHWILCSQQQIRNEHMLRRAITLSYEDLSERPDYCVDQVIKLVPELDDLDIRKDVAVHSLDGDRKSTRLNSSHQIIS